MTDNKKLQDVLDFQAVKDITSILQTEHGRRFFMWLFDLCGYNSTSFTRDSRTYFQEGQRNIALLVRSTILVEGNRNMNALHKAENEYFKLKNDIKDDIERNDIK